MQKEGEWIGPTLLIQLDEMESVDKLNLDYSSSAVLEELIESKSNIEFISQEDLAWVDSCLVADPELSLENWASLKEALFDSITNFADSFEVNNGGGPDEADKNEQMEVAVDKKDADDVRVVVNCTEGDDSESIFRVWNLHEEKEEHELIPELTWAVADFHVVKEEDDQFLTELKQEVAESILMDKQSDGIDETSIVEDAKLDELISNMVDLSLRSIYK